MVHGEDCAYTHSMDKHPDERNELGEKVCLLEKKVAELNNKGVRQRLKDLNRLNKFLSPS